MQDPSITSWLNHLRQLVPATGLVLVGAGAGTDQWIQHLREWALTGITLVEADELRFQHLRQSTALNSDWRLCLNVIAQQSGPVAFHNANNPGESGLLDPQSLQSLWRNLTTKDVQTKEAITLADLLNDSPNPVNWLVIDCLPALAILSGAGQRLDKIDVIVARVLVEELSEAHAGSGLTSLKPFLEGNGFIHLATETELHPGLGHALFVRDSMTVLKSLRTQLADAETPNPELQQQGALIQTLQQQLAEAESQAAEARLKVGHLEEELGDLRLRTRLHAEELTRAEVQISLIKDIMFQERPT